MQLSLKEEAQHKGFVGIKKWKKKQQWNSIPEFAYLQSFYQKPVFATKKHTKVCVELKRKAEATLTQSYQIKALMILCRERISKDITANLVCPLRNWGHQMYEMLISMTHGAF